MQDKLIEIREQEYDLRLTISRLTQALHDINDPAAAQTQLDAIAEQQARLNQLEQQRVALQTSDP